MGVVTQGEVIRFDQVKGYGFIAPTTGGEDVFLHVNDLLDDKHLIRPGAVVEFVLEPGERGPKASSVHVVRAAAPVLVTPASVTPASVTPAAVAVAVAVAPRREGAVGSVPLGDSGDELVEVLSRPEFTGELTEVLLRIEPALTGPQVLAVRDALSALAGKYGWIAG
jgi:cold shock CspA family protein